MAAKDRLILFIVLVMTCLGIVHSSSIRPENLDSPELSIELPNEMPLEDMDPYFDDEEKQNVQDYEIVYPFHIKGSRGKSHTSSAQETIEYGVAAFGEEFWLVLKHNDKLLSPGCVMEEHVDGDIVISPCVKTYNNENESGEATSDDDCFYYGYSKNHNNSIISISLCSGLHGIIRVPQSDHDIIIKPMEEYDESSANRDSASSTPHLIYRKPRKTSYYDSLEESSMNNIKIPKRQTNRVKRSDQTYYLELVLVADATMNETYGSDLRQDLLLHANLAAGRFTEPSLVKPIHIVVVEIIILDVGNEGLHVSGNADKTLKSFCGWMEKRMNKPGSINYDTAALIFRLDKITNSRTVSGKAEVGGACSKDRSCLIVHDESLALTGITLAHEIGHSLGMQHDGTFNNCFQPNFIMAAAPTKQTDSFAWSSCSSLYLSTFLRKHGQCLLNQPAKPIPYPSVLPGDAHRGTYQCTSWLGKGWYRYAPLNKPDYWCKYLACMGPYHDHGRPVRVRPRPLLDGTDCYYKKQCIHGECVPIE